MIIVMIKLNVSDKMKRCLGTGEDGMRRLGDGNSGGERG